MSQNPSIPLITIPGVSASHILGDNEAELGSGDLTLTLATSPDDVQLSLSRQPVFNLTVGKAVLPLYDTTRFGTVLGDERLYVFQPELGNDIKGYVRITLPDGVRQSGSEFQALQAQFEKLLVDRGLLKPGEGPNERSITIPDVTVYHVVGQTSIELARDSMTLSTVNTAEQKPSNDPEAVLLLAVGNNTFPLHRTTEFGTLAESDQLYVFRPEFKDSSLGPSSGFIKLELHGKGVSAAQEKFEQILIDYGLLKAGVDAVGDEFNRMIREDATDAASAIRQGKAEFLAENPPTESATTSDPSVHRAADTVATGSHSVYNAAQTVTSSISTAASSAGAWFAHKLGPASPSTTESLNTVAGAYDAATSGISAGVGEIKDATTETVGDVVQNEYGKEAREVGGKIGEAVGNVGGAAGQVAELATGGPETVAAAEGVIVAENDMQEDEGVFKIQEREESVEWRDAAM